VAALTEERLKKAKSAAWVAIAVHTALALLKAFVGIKANSRVLLAGALHSASAVMASFALLSGLRAAKLPTDHDDLHPYKSGKARSIFPIVVSVLLLIMGAEMAISTMKALWNGVYAAPKSYALLIICVSIILKEIIARYVLSEAKKSGSDAHIANASLRRSDVSSSIAALVGVLGALLGTYMHIPLFYYFDPAAALFISLLVLKMGYNVIVEAIDYSHYDEAEQEDTAGLISTVQRVKGVITVDALRVREHGHYVIVDIKISVNPKISVLEGYDIARAAKQQLMKRFIHVSDVLVHVNPYDPGYPYKHNIDPEQDDFPSLVH
jgi:cation diffusion facilitator family transporter